MLWNMQQILVVITDTSLFCVFLGRVQSPGAGVEHPEGASAGAGAGECPLPPLHQGATL